MGQPKAFADFAIVGLSFMRQFVKSKQPKESI
jgi:hypothetical protein